MPKPDAETTNRAMRSELLTHERRIRQLEREVAALRQALARVTAAVARPR